MSEKIGLFGAGNMGSAIIHGLIKAKLYAREDILVYDVFTSALEKIQHELGVTTFTEDTTMAKQANIIFLAVKPNVVPSVLQRIKPYLTPDKLVISIAAGVTIDKIEGLLSTDNKIVRVMPNTPALVGEAMSGLAVNAAVEDRDKEKAIAIFSCFGKVELIGEYLIDAVVGVSGSAPAYVYMFIEALADGAVQQGMPRAMAYKFAAQTVLGAAKMVLETGKHPGELKDMVCSPGGTTIEAVKTLEEHNFRASVMAAVRTASEKNKML